MPRRIVVKKKDIMLRRAVNWEKYYALRQQAASIVAYGRDGARVCAMIDHRMSRPALNIDGGLADLATQDRVARRVLLHELELIEEDLVCWYLWTESAWMEYVKEFQALPDPVEDYYWTYNEETDQALLVPMSHRSRQVHPRYNLGTSPVVVPDEWKKTSVFEK